MNQPVPLNIFKSETVFILRKNTVFKIILAVLFIKFSLSEWTHIAGGKLLIN